jgi:fucose 4-O-acetylase-like acetyltransferase
MRFIYAFHMPLFFMLAGFFFRPPSRFGERLRVLAARRLVPVLFFSVLLLPLWLVGPLRHGLPVWAEIGPQLEDYLRGNPGLNWVTWFLVCLFVCECMALGVLPRLRSVAARAVGGLVALWIGVVLCNHIDLAAHLFGIEQHTWFVYEAVVALGFYMLGNALYPALQGLAGRPAAAALVGVVGLALALASYQLNPLGPHATVMMSTNRQGEPLAFIVTALSGSIGVMALAMALRRSRLLATLGSQSIVMLGLSGLFFHFVNPLLVRWWVPPEAPLGLTLYTLVITAASLAVSSPLAGLLMRWVPQLLGQPPRSSARAVSALPQA